LFFSAASMGGPAPGKLTKVTWLGFTPAFFSEALSPDASPERGDGRLPT
jgi:hypothetical protein